MNEEAELTPIADDSNASEKDSIKNMESLLDHAKTSWEAETENSTRFEKRTQLRMSVLLALVVAVAYKFTGFMPTLVAGLYFKAKLVGFILSALTALFFIACLGALVYAFMKLLYSFSDPDAKETSLLGTCWNYTVWVLKILFLSPKQNDKDSDESPAIELASERLQETFDDVPEDLENRLEVLGKLYVDVAESAIRLHGRNVDRGRQLLESSKALGVGAVFALVGFGCYIAFSIWMGPPEDKSEKNGQKTTVISTVQLDFEENRKQESAARQKARSHCRCKRGISGCHTNNITAVERGKENRKTGVYVGGSMEEVFKAETKLPSEHVATAGQNQEDSRRQGGQDPCGVVDISTSGLWYTNLIEKLFAIVNQEEPNSSSNPPP